MINLRGSYARAIGNEVWLYGVHIASYENAGPNNHEPQRARKLLLHKKEVSEIKDKLAQKGLTLVPLRVYVKKRWVKMKLGLGRGKKKYDKRRTIMDRDREREASRAIKRRLE